jgi:hypothetical protein
MRYLVVQNMNFERGMRPTVSRTRLYSTPSNFELQQQSAPSQTHTLLGTSRWQLRKTPGLPTSRRNSRNDQGTQIVMTWISLSSKVRNNLIYVPEGPICLKILRECHNNTLGGSLWNSTDSRTSVKDLLVAQNEQAATRVCQVL